MLNSFDVTDKSEEFYFLFLEKTGVSDASFAVFEYFVVSDAFETVFVTFEQVDCLLGHLVVNAIYSAGSRSLVMLQLDAKH